MKNQQSKNKADQVQLMSDTCSSDRMNVNFSDSDKTQQVNCRGDKIENITQLLTHLGMDDIRHKCDNCDEKTRKECLEKESKTVKVNKQESMEKRVTYPKRPDQKLIDNERSKNIKSTVESKHILRYFFATLFIVVMSFQ